MASNKMSLKFINTDNVDAYEGLLTHHNSFDRFFLTVLNSNLTYLLINKTSENEQDDKYCISFKIYNSKKI